MWRTFADAAGHFQLSLLDLPESTGMIVTVLTPTGYQKQDTIWVQVKKEAPQIVLATPIPGIASEDTLRLSGQVANTVRMTCNGAEVRFVEGRFSHRIKLQPGKNVIKLTASDALANECVLQQEVMLDKTPPELLDYSVVVKTTAGEDVAEVRIKARDGSGLRRTASINLQAGDMLTSGYVVFDQTAQSYQGSFKYPKGTLKEVKIKSLVLEDYYGNQSILTPQ